MTSSLIKEVRHLKFPRPITFLSFLYQQVWGVHHSCVLIRQEGDPAVAPDRALDSNRPTHPLESSSLSRDLSLSTPSLTPSSRAPEGQALPSCAALKAFQLNDPVKAVYLHPAGPGSKPNSNRTHSPITGLRSRALEHIQIRSTEISGTLWNWF